MLNNNISDKTEIHNLLASNKGPNSFTFLPLPFLGMMQTMVCFKESSRISLIKPFLLQMSHKTP